MILILILHQEHRLRYVLDERFQPTVMLYSLWDFLVLSSAQVEYKPVDLKSYEARNGASLAQFSFSSMYRRLQSTRLIIDIYNISSKAAERDYSNSWCSRTWCTIGQIFNINFPRGNSCGRGLYHRHLLYNIWTAISTPGNVRSYPSSAYPTFCIVCIHCFRFHYVTNVNYCIVPKALIVP